MKEQKLLLPIDVAKCPLEVFEVVKGLARRAETTVVLLHVVTLNILAPENRVYEELHAEALSYLQRLAHLHLAPEATPVFRVRFGSAAEAILEEARAENVDLIILPAPAGSVWTRLTAFWKCQAERVFRPDRQARDPARDLRGVSAHHQGPLQLPESLGPSRPCQ